MHENKIVILLVEDNKDFAKLVEIYLKKFEKDKFIIIWRENGPAALQEAESNKEIDIVLMDYFLPGMNGLEITKTMQEKHINLPIIFLTVNKDFELALEVLRYKVDDYLVKEEITSPVLPKSIIEILEKQKLKNQLMELEVKQKRVEVLQNIVAQVVKNISDPLQIINEQVQQLNSITDNEEVKPYLKIINDNFQRVITKFEKIKNLKQDKTITYIKGIKMIDLTE